MLEQLQEHLSRVIKNIKGQGKISKSNISETLRDIRIALLEADVNLGVAKKFIEHVKEKALGEKVLNSISPSQQFTKILHDEKFDGLNITLPYKEIAYKSLSEIDLSAQQIKIVNCIKSNNSKLTGFNTDYFGFLKMIKCEKINFNNKNILVLGYGATAKTIIHAILENYSSNIYISGRSNHSIKKTVSMFTHYEVKQYDKTLNKNYIIINCTPIRIDTNSIKNILSYLPLSNADLFIDINYIETDLAKIAKKNKIKVILGIDMLIYQAIKSFDIWFNKKYSKEINFSEIKKHILNK